jgi:hypothetical protein
MNRATVTVPCCDWQAENLQGQSRQGSFMSNGYIGQYGEYERAGRRLSLLDARLSFIYAIAEHYPEVFESLHGNPLEKYRETGLLSGHGLNRASFWSRCIGCSDRNFYLDGSYKEEGLPSIGGTIDHLKNIHPGNYFLRQVDPHEIKQMKKERLPVLIEWWECLQDWAETHHIKKGWMLHYAFLKIDSYAEGNKGRDALYTYQGFGMTDYFGLEIQPKLVEGGGLYHHAGSIQHEPFSFIYQGWRPTLTDENAYRKYVFEMCELQLDEYLKNAHERMRGELNMQKIPDKREPKHYAWLAQYQCGNQSMSDIATSENLSEDAIRSGIHAASRFIGLTLRPPKRGRKKGSKDRSSVRRIVRRT